MFRHCSIWIQIEKQKAEAAMRRVLQLKSLKPKPNAVRIFPISANKKEVPEVKKELCIEFQLPVENTDHEAEETMKNIWSDLSGELKEFRDLDAEITI